MPRFCHSLTAGLLLAFAAGLLASDAAELQPLRPGTELFVDDIGIETKANVVRRIHPAAKLDRPVLRGENGASARIYGTVQRDPDSGLFRMWYGRSYATSRDGLNWEKPVFDFYPVRGQPTNIVLPKGGGGVLFDAAEPDPARRYKALLAEPIQVGGLSAYYSADGLHWNRYGSDRVTNDGSEIAMVMRDPATREYLGYIRPYPPKHFPQDNTQKRLGAVITSTDFVHWTKMNVVLEPDAVDDVWVSKPDQRTEFYSMKGFAYGGGYLGIVPVFRIEQIVDKTSPTQSRYDGPMEGQLITSRDGRTWSRMEDRSLVLPGGAQTKTAFDRSIMDVASAPLVVGDELWLYYTGINTTHGAPAPPKEITIGLAKWRLDGWVSLEAGGELGTVETTLREPLASGNHLEINARVMPRPGRGEPGGSVAVEVLDEKGDVLPGYHRDACIALRGDAVHYNVRWKNQRTLPSGIPFRLRFVFQQASLFSFTLMEKKGHPSAE